MSNILFVNSSPRKKATYSLLKRVEKQLNGHEIEFINLKDFSIKQCIGCENCLRKGSCAIIDDAEALLRKFAETDGIVLGTPVYLRQITGYLKLLIDRGCSWYHRSPLVGKPILFVTATQVTGLKESLVYLNDLSVQWGTINSGSIARTMFNIEKDLEKKPIERFNYYLNRNNINKYRPSFKEIFEFNTQKVLALQILPLDKKYWTEKNYLEQPYFYKCKIGLVKRITGFIFFTLLNSIISKNKVES